MQTLTWSPQLQYVIRGMKKLDAKQNVSTFKDWKSILLSQKETDAVQTVYQNQQKGSVDTDTEIEAFWD